MSALACYANQIMRKRSLRVGCVLSLPPSLPPSFTPSLSPSHPPSFSLNSSYDLLHEEDPDEFVTIEIPAETVDPSNVSPLLKEHRRRGRDFHLLGRKKNSSPSLRKRMASDDISQVGLCWNHTHLHMVI